MSIKFYCSCGKPLRARDEMAARRSICPRCGAPVGIPSLRPTHNGTEAAPLTPQERRRLRRDTPRDEDDASAGTITVPPWDPFVAPPDPSVIATTIAPCSPFVAPPTPVELLRQRRRPRPRQLETHWYQCLAYPFVAWWLLLILTWLLTLLSGGFALLMPRLPRDADISLGEGAFYAIFMLVSLLILAYACSSVECALTSALAGAGPGMYWPGRDIGAALKSGLRWLICFLAGPIVPSALACYYWIHGGDLTGLDWAILAELCVLAIAYWLLALLRSIESGRLRDANPVRVAQLVHRLRYRAVVPVLLAPGLVLAHGLLGFHALGELHGHDYELDWLLLGCCWISGLFWATFIFRLLGVWCYRSPASGENQGPETGLG